MKIGERYDMWTIVGAASRKHYVLCKCDCGRLKEVLIPNIKNGSSGSCGCRTILHAIKKRRTHGCSNQKLYYVLSMMKARCYDKGNPGYKNYGGRGVHVCDEWTKSPAAFINWCIKNGYKEGLQIDRIDNNGNYEPNNCRFVTVKDNSRNTRRNRYITFNGRRQCIAKWCEELGFKKTTIHSRLSMGWSIKKILTTPLRTR